MTDKHQRYKGRDLSEYATFLGETMDTDDEASAAFGADVEACGDATPISSSSVWADQPSSSILNAAGMQGNPGVARHDFDTVVYATFSPSSKLIKPESVTTQELIAARSRNEFGEMSREPRPIKMEPQDEVFLYDVPVDNDHESDDGASDEARDPDVTFSMLNAADVASRLMKESDVAASQTRGLKGLNTTDPASSSKSRMTPTEMKKRKAGKANSAQVSTSESDEAPRKKRKAREVELSSESDEAPRKKRNARKVELSSESDEAPRKKRKARKVELSSESSCSDRDSDSGIDDKEIPDIEVVYDEYWTEQDEQTLRDDFQDPDESVCHDAMVTLIRKTGARFGMMPFDLVPEGGIPQNISSPLCVVFGKVVKCTAFIRNPQFLKYCLALARYIRLGKKHLKPSTDDLDLDENGLVAKFKKNMYRVTGSRKVDADTLKAFKMTHNLESQRPTHFKMAKVLKDMKVASTRHKDENANAITKGDLDAICKAWDKYVTKSKGSSLQLMQDIPDIAVARGPSKKGQINHVAIAREKHAQWLLNRERISRRITNESTRSNDEIASPDLGYNQEIPESPVRITTNKGVPKHPRTHRSDSVYEEEHFTIATEMFSENPFPVTKKCGSYGANSLVENKEKPIPGLIYRYPYWCDECPRRFNSAHALDQHNKAGLALEQHNDAVDHYDHFTDTDNMRECENCDWVCMWSEQVVMDILYNGDFGLCQIREPCGAGF
ncbi:hypothetical protein HYFRA_00002561 [Hymenoscyphus fraxineus]|uniref:C2H2-type domain-containing protein n=1 Tax=Hymenoscyphus fraxineus TaxID=746836 RepID=A0A9N9L9K3_9HELO|nr:hypothetical protein HYFRA_00002561 [Hymenoscyphus fraxineus]